MNRNKLAASKSHKQPSTSASSSNEERDRNVIAFGILRHYWYQNLCLDEALFKIRKSEGPNAISFEKARKWFDYFEKGIFTLPEELAAKNAPKNPLLKMRFADAEYYMQQMVQRRIQNGIVVPALPTEIWVEVFSYLVPFPHAFLRLECVNVHWHAIVSKYFWPIVTHLNGGDMKGVELHALACRFGEQITNMRFGRKIAVPLRDIISQMQSLRQLHIGLDVKVADLEAIPISLPQLQHLELMMGNKNYSALPNILQRCNRLEHLKLCFAGQPQSDQTNRREFDLRISVNLLPSGLKHLEVLDAGVFLPHLLELAQRDCVDSLQVLITGLQFTTIFESMEVAETFVNFKNLHYLQIGVGLDTLASTVSSGAEMFGSLRAFSCGKFDDKLLSLLCQHCPQLEHLRICWAAHTKGRKSYRTLAYVLTKMHQLRSLEVVDTVEYSHKWRLAFLERFVQYRGGENLEFLNLMIDMPFQRFLQLIKNCKKLTRLNCFTITDFQLGATLNVLNNTKPQRQSNKYPAANGFVQRPNGRDPLPPAPQLLLGIINKYEFEKTFHPLKEEHPYETAVHFQRGSVTNPVEWELRQPI